MSFVEAWVNVAVGYVISALLTYAVLPMFGYGVQVSHALGISLVFTVASLVRSYTLRRIFAGVR